MIKLKKEGEYLMGYNENNVACCYYPLTKEAKELDLSLLPSFEVTKSIEHLAEEKTDEECQIDSSLDYAGFYKGFISGYKEAQSKQYSLEDINKAIEFAFNAGRRLERKAVSPDFSFVIYREKLIQSLSTQRLPKEFEPIMYPKYTQYYGFEEDDEIPVMTPMTSTNSEGKQEIQGRYVY